MATEGIMLDIGAIYKRIFNHRAIIQNEILFFIEEFETKRGDNDLKLLQTSLKVATDINALYLEEMKESLPQFDAARLKMAEITEKGNKILDKKQEFELPEGDSSKLAEELAKMKDAFAEKRKLLDEQVASKIEELKAEAQLHKETRARLKTGRPASTASEGSISV